MPEIPLETRKRLRTRLTEEGAEALHGELSARDPETAGRVRPSDGQRIVRALEIIEATGRPIGSYQQSRGPVIIDPARAQKIVVLPERPVLHGRIDRRFETMLARGAVEEVRALLALRLPPEMPVMKAIGVPQIAAMLKGEMSEKQVIEAGAAATRQYAKRQMTWFRNQLDETWQRIEDPDALG